MIRTKNNGKKLAEIHSYTVFFEPMVEGGYNVVVPAIPEICTFGENLKEAKEMAADAILCFLESAMEEGEPIPKDKPMKRDPVKATIEVALV